MRHPLNTSSILFIVPLLLLAECLSSRVAERSRQASLRTRTGSPATNAASAELIDKRQITAMVAGTSDERQLMALPAGKHAEILKPGDQIEIVLFEKQPVSQEKRIEMKNIDDQGAVNLYPFGTIPLAGLTPEEAKTSIEQKMTKYIVSPFCEVTLVKKAYEPRVFVFGEAAQPGTFPIGKGERLLDILSLAKGTTPKAFRSSIKLVRIYGDSVGVMSINLNELFKRGRVENNIVMQDQDIIFIPARLFSSATEVISALSNVLPWYYFLNNFRTAR